MAKLVRAGDGWVFRTVGEGVPITKPTEGLAKLRPFV
jgi:stress response protein SCP2